MEIRLLLAFVLMGLVLFVSQYFYKPPAPVKAPTPAPAAAAVTPIPNKAPDSPPPTPVEGVAAAQTAQEISIDTDYYKVIFSNRGATVQSWTLKKFKDSTGKPLDLVNTSVLGKVEAPFSLVFPANAKPSTDLNSALFVSQLSSDGLGVDFEFSDGKISCRKSFHFQRDSYISKISSEVTQNGAPQAHMMAWRGGFGDETILNAAAVQQSLYYDLTDSKLRKKSGKDAKKEIVTAKGNYSFAGMEDNFFAAVFLPTDNSTIEFDTYGDNLPRGPEKKEDPHVGVAVGGDSANRFSLFVGPKDVDLLNTVDPKLKQLIDWGWFGVIAKPLFTVMKAFNTQYIRNWGWTIVLTTIGINLLLLPLRFTSMRSAKKMQALQPQITAINAKYKGIKLNDPRNAEKNTEVMDLYKKHGVNPVGGCLPMIIQLPFFYAFYKVLSVAIELRGAPWMWVHDLSQPEHLAIRVLPVVMIVTQFLMQKMTPNPSVDPSQQRMMMFMPLVMGFFFYYQSSGLVLYWLTSNLVGILTQYSINRFLPAAPQPVKAAPTKKLQGAKAK
jgi:YidC/Oxa1 family membrane protein insertase